LDAAYLFQNYNSYLSPEEVAVAEEFAEHIVTFIDGKEPWSKYDKDGTALVLGDDTVKEGEVWRVRW
jgi:hypothetical protein